MITIISNVSGNLQGMEGPDIVRTYNDLANSDRGKELNARTVQRFSDRNTAIKRIEALRSSIKAREKGLKMEEGKSKATQATTGLDSFQACEGTNRMRLIKCLLENLNRMVPMDVLLAATYQRSADDMRGAIKAVLNGVRIMIDKHKLDYELKKEGKSYGLYETVT